MSLDDHATEIITGIVTLMGAVTANWNANRKLKKELAEIQASREQSMHNDIRQAFLGAEAGQSKLRMDLFAYTDDLREEVRQCRDDREKLTRRVIELERDARNKLPATEL